MPRSTLFLIFLFFNLLFSQHYNFVNYTEKYDLPGNQVWSIYQDSRGYMWFCTTAGLIKYDGISFHFFDDKDSLINYYVINARDDSRGWLWVGSENGVSVLKGDKVKNYYLGTTEYQVYVDSYDRTWAYSIFRPGDIFCIEKEQVWNFSDQYGFKNQHIPRVGEDDQGGIYFLTVGGDVFRYFAQKLEKYFSHESFPGFIPTTFFFNHKGQMIYCGSKGAIKILQKKESTVLKYEWLLKDVFIMDGLESRRGYYWFASRDSGLYQIKENEIKKYTIKNGLSSNSLFCLLEDREYNLWIGTKYDGVIKLNSLRIKNFGRAEGFQDEVVLKIIAKGNSVYLAGDKHIYRFDDNRLKKLTKEKKLLMDILPLNGRQWMVGTLPGLFLWEEGKSYQLVGLEKQLVSTFTRDSHGGIWVGTDIGVFKYFPPDRFVFQDLGIKDTSIKSILEVNGKDLYIATSKGLIIIENATTDSGEKIIHRLTTQDGLTSDILNDIETGPDGDVLLGTSNGITILTSKGEIQGLVDGFKNNFVVDIFTDSKENVWIGTNSGLSLVKKIDGQYRVVRSYSINDGLISNEFSKSGCISEDVYGRIWLGTYNGVNLYDPNEDYMPLVKPNCVLEKVIINDSLKLIPGDQTEIPRFSYQMNQFQFAFVGLSFFDEKSVYYLYYLEPLELPWNGKTSLGNVNYKFLKPGRYTFHVKTVNAFGVSSDPQSWSFIIQAPFWQSTWFYAFISVLLLGLGYLINYRRLQHSKKMREKLARLVEEQTAEIRQNHQKLREQYRQLVEAQKELVEKERLERALREIEQLKDKLRRENIYLREERGFSKEVNAIIGVSKHIETLREKIIDVAKIDTTVLITGETGTGKNLVAETIHALSNRREHAMITVNCAAIPEGLLESELFGHEKGAFTGANRKHLGKFEIAHGSTIFLDEIGSMNLSLQAKILTFLQEKKFTRVGDNEVIHVDVRIIAATNQNLEDLIRAGKFREDLYYRLNIFPLYILPLRKRKEDIEVLTKYFIAQHSRRLNKTITSIRKDALNKLMEYDYPGNVRELSNIIERAVIICTGEVIRDTDIVIPDRVPVEKQLFTIQGLTTLEELERRYISLVLEKTGHKVQGKGGAAEILGLHPNTLRHRIKKLGIDGK